MKLRTKQTHSPIPTFSGRSIPPTFHYGVHYTLWVHSFVYFLIPPIDNNPLMKDTLY